VGLMLERIKTITGELFFTETKESISGYILPKSEVKCESPYSLRKRSLPILDNNFQPTNKRYELWEVVLGNASFFFKSLVEAEIAILESVGQ